MGGMDIWVCKREGDAWSKPENLGPEVNTTADELFPYLRNDGILFYSSDGLVGMGARYFFCPKRYRWEMEKCCESRCAFKWSY